MTKIAVIKDMRIFVDNPKKVSHKSIQLSLTLCTIYATTMVNVSGFMVPADKVIKMKTEDSISKALDLVLEHGISAVLIFDSDEKPAGIVTKTDLVAAYRKSLPLEDTVSTIMSNQLETLLDTDSRDDAAKLFEKRGHHHAVVNDKDGKFVGFISVLDIASEVARDARAWPYLRGDDGKVHLH